MKFVEHNLCGAGRRGLLLGLLSLLMGCGSGAKLTTKPIKWVDPDNRAVLDCRGFNHGRNLLYPKYGDRGFVRQGDNHVLFL